MANWNTIPGNVSIAPGETIMRSLDDTIWQGFPIPTDKSEIGLNNVDNVSDANKPISTLTQEALDLKADASSLALVATTGDYDDLSNKPSAPVTSVNSKTGDVVLDHTDVGADVLGAWLDAYEGAVDYTDATIAALPPVVSTGSYNDLSNKPTIPAAQVQSDWNAVSGLGVVLNKPSIPSAPSQSAQSRTLNTAFQVSTTRGSWVHYSVSIANVMTIVGGAGGVVILEIATNSGFTTGVQTIGQAGNSNTGGLVVGITLNDAITAQVNGYVPASYYVRLRTNNTTGTPTYTYLTGQEVLV